MHYVRKISRVLPAVTVFPSISYKYQGRCYSKAVAGKTISTVMKKREKSISQKVFSGSNLGTVDPVTVCLACAD